MPELDLDELERLAAQATPGPWEMDNNYNIRIAEGGHPLVITINDDEDWIPRPSDARYITAACNALPELIARVRELEAKNKDLGIRSMLNNGRAFRLADYIANSGMCAFCPAYDEFCMADGACRLVDCIEAIYKWADKQAAKEDGE